MYDSLRSCLTFNPQIEFPSLIARKVRWDVYLREKALDLCYCGFVYLECLVELGINRPRQHEFVECRRSGESNVKDLRWDEWSLEL